MIPQDLLNVAGALCKSPDCALTPGKNGRKSGVYTSLLSILSPFLTQLEGAGRAFAYGSRSLSDLGVRREGKRDRDQNLCKFEANSGLFNEDLRKFWPGLG